MSHHSDQIGYVGLGHMGLAMATNIQAYLSLHDHQPPLVVFNRTVSRAEPVVAKGATLASRVEEVAERCDVVLTCLANDNAVIETYEQLLSAKEGLRGKNKLFVDQSTIDPATTTQISEHAAKWGVQFVACPIFGPPAAATSAQLILAPAGPEDAKKRLQHLFTPVIGKMVIDVGENVANASKLKLVGNFFITSMVEMLAEGLTLGEKCGLGQDKVSELLQTLFANTLLASYSQRMTSNSFMVDLAAGERPLFSISNATKDVKHALALAHDCGTRLPISDIMLSHLDRAKEQFGDIDYSGVVAVTRLDAGLPSLLRD